MGRKRQQTEEPQAQTTENAPNGEGLSPLEKARLAPRGPRTAFHLVMGTDERGNLRDVLHSAKSGHSAQKWIDVNAALLARLTSGVVVLRCKPVAPPQQ